MIHANDNDNGLPPNDPECITSEYEKQKPNVIIGDCLKVLRSIESNTYRTCITSPPYYKMRDYRNDGQFGQEETPAEFIAKLIEVFREVRRTLSDDGTLWLNIDDTYYRNGNMVGIPFRLALPCRMTAGSSVRISSGTSQMPAPTR